MNTKEHKKATESNPPDMDNVLHSFLGWLEERFKQSAKDAGKSQSFLNMGMKDQFAQEWEAFLKSPIDSMYSAKKTFDASLQNFINVMVSTYLKSKKDIISKVLWTESGNNTLYYCISLKDDTLDNRIAVNDFFDFYDDYSLSSNYPVYFHFISEKHIANIKFKKQIA